MENESPRWHNRHVLGVPEPGGQQSSIQGSQTKEARRLSCAGRLPQARVPGLGPGDAVMPLKSRSCQAMDHALQVHGKNPRGSVAQTASNGSSVDRGTPSSTFSSARTPAAKTASKGGMGPAASGEHPKKQLHTGPCID